MSAAANSLVFGATGLVGRHCLDQLLERPGTAQVVSLARRTLRDPPSSARWRACQTDYELLERFEPPCPIRRVYCAFGTTIKRAGSQARMKEVDVGYPLLLARRMRDLGASSFCLVSSLGADPSARSFYLRIKGELERELEALAFPSLVILRPSIIGGSREADPRPLEALGQRLGRFAPLSYRTVPAAMIAETMIRASEEDAAGTRILESRDIWRYSSS